MSYYHIIKSCQNLNLTLNVVIHITFNHKSCHQLIIVCHVKCFGENDCGDDMCEIVVIREFRD